MMADGNESFSHLIGATTGLLWPIIFHKGWLRHALLGGYVTLSPDMLLRSNSIAKATPSMTSDYPALCPALP